MNYCCQTASKFPPNRFDHRNIEPLRLLRTKDRFDITDIKEEVSFYLKTRKTLLEKSSIAVEHSRGLIDVIFSHNVNVPYNQRFSTREVIAGILLQLPPPMQKIWHDAINNRDRELNQLRKVFCWAFKSLVHVNSNYGISIKDRSVSMPYAVHTHVDVPFALASILKQKPDALTLAVACTHDSMEEGQFVDWDEENRKAQKRNFDVSKMPATFPFRKLGDQLSVSIPTLTESTYDEMKEQCGVPKLRQHVNDVLSGQESNHVINEYNGKFEKFFIKDPLVFGGLALQIQQVVQALLVEPNGDEPLAYSIVMTEIADRISDVSSLEYYFNYDSEFGPEAAHRRVLCFYSRITNMIEKLAETEQLFVSEEKKESISYGLQFLRVLLNQKINQLAELYSDQPLAFFSEDEIQESQKIMRSIQQLADAHMSDFINDKSTAILTQRQ